nr:unnamed protein product [Digitaria exilis]
MLIAMFLADRSRTPELSTPRPRRLRVADIVLFASSAAPSAWRARRDPAELAVVTEPSALLAALFVCIHRAERLAPGSSHGERRRRLLVAVWALSTLVFCLAAYQVSRVMSGAPAIAVWSLMAFFVVRAGILRACAPPRPAVPTTGRRRPRRRRC